MEPKEAKELCPSTLPRNRVYWHGVLSRCVWWGVAHEKQGLYGMAKEPAEDSSQLCRECKCLLHILGGVVRHGEGDLPLTLSRINLHTPDISLSVMFRTKCIKASVLHSEAWHWVGAGVSESQKRLLSFCSKSELRVVAYRCVFGTSKRHTLPPFPDKWAFWVLTYN